MFFRQKKSITVYAADTNDDIQIYNDEKFQGSDNCKFCQYNPCKVKKWHGKRKNIEDCKIFNKFNPKGKIIDHR